MSTQKVNLTAIADAIREKDGSTGKIVAADFPARIRAIKQGVDQAILAGGTAGQVLTKKTDADLDVQWKALTAADVGARPDTWTPTAEEMGAIQSPNNASEGQILTFDGENWVAQDPQGSGDSPEIPYEYKIGDILFSASHNVGPEWLQCNGDFISESQYPELVAALGKLTPSGDKFQLVSSGEIGPQISNGVLYGGRLWVYSYSTKKLYGVDIEGTAAVKEISITSEDSRFLQFVQPNNTYPLCLSIVAHKAGTGAKLFLTQFISDTLSEDISLVPYTKWKDTILIFQAEFTGSESSLSMAAPFDSLKVYANAGTNMSVPYIVSQAGNNTEQYLCVLGTTSNYVYYVKFNAESASIETASDSVGDVRNQRFGMQVQDKNECVFCKWRKNYGNFDSYSIPTGIFQYNGIYASGFKGFAAPSRLPLNVAGSAKVLCGFTTDEISWFSYVENNQQIIKHGLNLPVSSRIFVDAGAYLWGKDIYMIFVGTGIIFSRTLEEGSFGYLDTTSVLGTITQFGYLDYSQDEGTLYLLGQDTANTVKVAKMELNTLYDYANDGAWLPMIASDGVPAYIKAKEAET